VGAHRYSRENDRDKTCSATAQHHLPSGDGLPGIPFQKQLLKRFVRRETDALVAHLLGYCGNNSLINAADALLSDNRGNRMAQTIEPGLR